MTTLLVQNIAGHSRRTIARPNVGRMSTRPRVYSSATNKTSLTWPEYLEIRRSKRSWERAVTIPCAAIGLVGGLAYFGTLESDPTKPIFGLDPLLFYGMCTVGCLGAGALVGPTIGGAIWRSKHRSHMRLIEARDREFYRHIQKNRVDPTGQTPTNPVPDYYGEKIGSLHQYRQWLRDQARFKRKSQLPEE